MVNGLRTLKSGGKNCFETSNFDIATSNSKFATGKIDLDTPETPVR